MGHKRTQAISPQFLHAPSLLVSLRELAVLLYHLHRGAQDQYVGYEGMAHTLERVSNYLNRKVMVPQDAVESCLWSCNMLREKGEWRDIKDRTWEQFVRDLVEPHKFNEIYHLITRKGE